eukprot:CAMPEP_0196668112 /NCGR_PEP_ID=MMETSP1086-20130531/65447_1 /TAXON_ID=77921 /ORGANISM="Cyanoptyche  gloeocystis , Strain SAG4.97" /LENGTH=522 /DNA_ID=CAMNT_0042005497 /DNA_START=416 /DNA_END=1984 /DNA_ORIENTATION=+
MDNECQVIDGQQRLITLSILFSTFRYLLDDIHSPTVNGHLFLKLSTREGPRDEPMLTLRMKDDNEYFHTFIQRKGGFGQLLAVSHDTDSEDASLEHTVAWPKTDAQRHIQENAKCCYDLLNILTPNNLYDLFEYTLKQCFLINVSTTSIAGAFRIFTSLNGRGLPLSPVDKLKADLLDVVTTSRREEYARRWDKYEAKFGTNDFVKFFSVVFEITEKRPLPGDSYTALQEAFLKQGDVNQFFETSLPSYGDAFDMILNGFKSNGAVTPKKKKQRLDGETYRISVAEASKINDLLVYLKLLPNECWWTPATYFVSTKKDGSTLCDFFRNLERYLVLNRFLSLPSEDGVKILEDVEADRPFNNQLNPHECFRKAAQFDMVSTGLGRYLLLRIENDSRSNQNRSNRRWSNNILKVLKPKKVWVDTLLPQARKADSLHWADWNHNSYCNAVRLGNLVLVNREAGLTQNKQLDFDTKRQRLEGRGVDGNHRSFLVNESIKGLTQWRLQDFKERHDFLMLRVREIYAP